MRVVVLADTHLRGGLAPLPSPVLDAVAHAEVVLHAGDVTSAEALTELSSMAKTYAVLGNNDRGLEEDLPESLCLRLGGVEVAMVHDSGPAKGRPTRLYRRFPSAQLVIFGHSHQPVDEAGVGGQRLFNPGSPTQRRRAPQRSFGQLELDRGQLLRRLCTLSPS